MPILSITFVSMLTQDRVDSLTDAALKVTHLDGEFWDVGCNAGGSAAVMKAAVPCKHIRLFDSFEGLPASTEEDGANGRSREVGMFAIEAPECLQRLGTVHIGWVPETFKGLENSKIALAHVDLDYYRSMKEALEFILPRVVLNGYVVVDDYDSYWVGVKPATDEVMTDEFIQHPAPPEQAIFQRVRNGA